MNSNYYLYIILCNILLLNNILVNKVMYYLEKNLNFRFNYICYNPFIDKIIPNNYVINIKLKHIIIYFVFTIITCNIGTLHCVMWEQLLFTFLICFFYIIYVLKNI